ncbi:hypothetical protein FZEAL_8260 [Fusarium zealandicum]|uniref:Zn(2)-C6 fungal-type domain-containing protein n=1 Tax=Fusarium zealandicum TaxID=1053134 RepID=A0A8H4UEC9_9HYPO|nr:hypothetical protein FZEAL_8260 [Fusarium zealandicum]
MGSRAEATSSFGAQARVNSACLACKKRKAKCDGQVPSCQECGKRGIECIYSQRRFRGPGKTKEYTHRLEQRLKRLEGALQVDDSPTIEQVAVSKDNSESSRASVRDTPLDTSTARDQPDQIPKSLPPKPAEITGLRKLPDFPGLPVPGRYMSTFKLSSTVINMGVRSDTFNMVQFIPRLSDSMVLHSFRGVAQDICELYPLLQLSHMEELVKPQPLDDAVDKVARQTISDALLAIGIQWKTANSSFAELSHLAWGSFKSAVSTSPMLLFQGTSMLAYEALAIMAMYMQGSADMRIASHLSSFAVRAYQMFDAVHSREDLGEHYLRLFWTLASIDIDMSFRIGIPPALSMDDISKDLPGEHPSEHNETSSTPDMEHGIDVMRHRAVLSKIQFEVYQQLLSSQSKRCSSHELSLRAEKLEQKLDVWSESLPWAFQPRDESFNSEETLPTPVIVLHCIFHDLKIKLQPLLGTHSLEKCAASGRAIIRLMERIPTQQYTVIWRLLVYPASAMLLLLAVINNDPSGPSAQNNLETLRKLSSWVTSFVNAEQCDLGMMPEWCNRFVGVAEAIMSAELSTQYPIVQERLGQLLSHQTGFLRLAQSFMGKMTGSDSVYIQELSEVLGMHWAPEDEFGPFVPNVLKPKTHNFLFTFGA